jgi:hypothetical protein
MPQYQDAPRPASSATAPLLLGLSREIRDVIYDYMLTEESQDEVAFGDPYDTLVGFGPKSVELPGRQLHLSRSLHSFTKNP